MVNNSAKLDRRTKQHTEFGVPASNASRDMGRTKSWRKKKKKEKKEKKMNINNPIKHPLRGSLNIHGCESSMALLCFYFLWVVLLSNTQEEGWGGSSSVI